MGVARLRCAAGACLVAALGLSQGQASAQQSQNWKWCVNENKSYSADLQINGCTALIDSGRESRKNLAIAFYNRCHGYNNKGDLDRAIADCNEAIRLDPKYVDAFNGRGITYKNKGDHDRAIADYDTVIRLDPKLATAYSNRGNAYEAKGDHDRAIADYSEAIRLDPKLAGAYMNRGNAYNNKGDLDRAIADYDVAIRLDPEYSVAFYNRGIAYDAKGDHDRAIADYDQAIRLDPKYSRVYNNRGVAYLFSGSLAKAQADFKQASELDPNDAYVALWLDLAEHRNHIPSHLAQAATQLDMKTWPAPVIRLFLGESTPAEVLAAADDPDPKKKQGQICEANFYSGELALLDGSKQEAARLFRLAADGCPNDFIERFAANAELKALGLKP